MVTMRDIAREARVSVSAVSYAINNTGSVGAEKRRRILEVVRRHRYRPNSAARKLKAQITRTIGVLTDLRRLRLRAQILEAASREIDLRGYSTLLINDTGDHEKAIHVLAAERVEGIIYLSYTTEEFARVFDINVPIVFAFCHDKAYGDASVFPDDAQGGYVATRHLLELGHRRGGVITGQKTWKAVKDRLRGYRRALRERGIPVDRELVVASEFDNPTGNLEAARRLLSKSERPSAVFAFADPIAVSVYEVARDLGLRIPQDVAVVGYNDYDYCEFLSPTLTSVAIPVESIGRIAARKLFRRIDGEHAEKDPPHALKNRLVVRQSTAG